MRPHAPTLAPLRRLLTPVLLACLLAATGLLVLGLTGLRADAAVNHGVVVGETPRNDLPIVLDGKVRAHAQVGQRIFVGGDFQQVLLQDGTIVNQPYIFAYDINTGAFDTNFRPVVNKLIRDLEATPAGDGLYVGGLFTSWDGAFPLRIAKLDALGNLDTTFSASANAKVLGIAARGDTVFIGGNFTDVSGQPRSGLAALDAQTGAVDPGFVMDVTNSVAGSSLVRMIVLSDDGNSLFALHYGNFVNGQTREAVAKIDVSGATAVLSGWNVQWEAQAGARSCRDKTRDLAISPDDSFIIVASQGADYPPNCDAAIKYPTAGDSTVSYMWVARMYSSVLSVAVSDVAVYLGGHFCAAPKNPIPPGGVSSTWPGTANACDINDPSWPWNPSQLDPDNAVFRKQLAALDPVTGQALPWDPGSNAFAGTLDLTLIDRGLLMGQDRDRYNDILTGRSGFIDFGAPGDTIPPTIAATTPPPGSVVIDPTELAGNAADNNTVASVTIRLKNITTGLWLQPDGSFGPTMADLPVTVTPTGLGTVDWSYPVAGLPEGDYEIRGFSTDAVGNTSDPLVSPFRIPGATTCTVVLDANDDPEVTYSGFEDGAVTSVFVRRDGSWLATVPAGSGSYTDVDPAPGDHSYLIRWRPGGVTTDVPCTPDPITVPDPDPGDPPTCTVVLDANDDPVVTYSGFEDGAVTSVFVRRDAKWLATVPAGSGSYTDVDPAPGPHSYLIRWRPGGVTADVPCTPDPVTVPDPDPGDPPTCTVALDANDDPVLVWDPVAGVNTYNVREATGWIATVTGATTYTHTAATPGDHSYTVRYNPGGGPVDIGCTPDPITVPDPDPDPDPGGQCTATVDANGDVILTWTEVPGEDKYTVRDDLGWVATLTAGELTYTDTDPTPGARTYTIRNRMGGVTNDRVCEPNPIDVP